MWKRGKGIYEMRCWDCVHETLERVGFFRVHFCEAIPDFIRKMKDKRAEIDVLDYPNYIVYRSCAYFEVKEETLEKILKDYPNP